MSDKLRTFSQAIRLGASFRPQAFGIMFDADGGSCAIGAAYEAVTGIGGFEQNGRATEIYKELEKRFPGSERIGHSIVIFNDGTKFTREQIADWVEEQGL